MTTNDEKNLRVIPGRDENIPPALPPSSELGGEDQDPYLFQLRSFTGPVMAADRDYAAVNLEIFARRQALLAKEEAEFIALTLRVVEKAGPILNPHPPEISDAWE